MKIAEHKFGPWSCWQVESWRASKLLHGFLGAELDLSLEQKSGTMVIPALKQWEQKAPSHRSLMLLEQVHGTEVIMLTQQAELGKLAGKAHAGRSLPQADGWLIAASCPGLEHFCFGIKTADCVPVILKAAGGEYFAVIHCGWRGIAAGFLVRMIQQFRALGVSADEVEIAIGPSAGLCCYGVGAEVRQALEQTLVENTDFWQLRGDAQIYCDLKSVLSKQARQCGVGANKIVSASECTICDTRFFSYRRQKNLAGRQLSFIAVKPHT